MAFWKVWKDRTWHEFLELGPIIIMAIVGCFILVFHHKFSAEDDQ